MMLVHVFEISKTVQFSDDSLHRSMILNQRVEYITHADEFAPPPNLPADLRAIQLMTHVTGAIAP